LILIPGEILRERAKPPRKSKRHPLLKPTKIKFSKEI